jgi:hypothetical protein
MGQVRGLATSNHLISKGAKRPFEEDWVDRLSRLEMEGPIALLIDDELASLAWH